jgi:hypothetical protein
VAEVASVIIKSAGEKYTITLSRPTTAVGSDSRFAGTLASLVDGILEDYSPALGGQASFVARKLKERLGVAVVSVDEPPSEKGVVY